MQNAKLRIHAYTATVDGPAVYTTSNSWSENTLNWNTRPLRTSAATDDKGAIAANTWVEYDVTPFVTGNGTYSFTLAQTSSDGVDFRAREYTANRPELVLTTGADSQKPTPPGNLKATAGTGQVALTWQASTDNVGVTGYRVFRGTTQIASSGRVGDVPHRHRPGPGPLQLHGARDRRRAEPLRPEQHGERDGAGHDEADGRRRTSPPTAGTGQVALTWQASTDNVGVTGYRVFRGTTQIATLGAAATSYTDTGLAAGPLQLHGARDRRGAATSPTRATRRAPPSATRPSRPRPATFTATAGTAQVALDLAGLDRQRRRDRLPGVPWDQQIASSSARRRPPTPTPASPPGPYSYTVRAIDAAGTFGPEQHGERDRPRHDEADRARQPHARPRARARSRWRWQASSDNVG